MRLGKSSFGLKKSKKGVVKSSRTCNRKKRGLYEAPHKESWYIKKYPGNSLIAKYKFLVLTFSSPYHPFFLELDVSLSEKARTAVYYYSENTLHTIM